MTKIYKNIKVLLVEDDSYLIEELSPILKKYFKHIDFALTGLEGLKKAQEYNYDIIITDIVMPEMDGIEMIKEIKKHKDPKFIVITAYSNKEFFIELIELGINAYLIKPITFKQIANTLKKVTNEIYKELAIQKHIQEIEKLSKIKSEFLANMSHEIRTPLNAILGFIKIMKEEDDGKFEKYLNTIDSASQTLLTIINDVLEFSKIESGKMKIEHIDFKSDELYNAIELFEAKAKEKHIDFKMDFINIPDYLYGDIHRIKQIITNLLSNAIKFTPENKSITTLIKYENNKLYVEVKDEGIGIPKDKLSVIFHSFSQADNSTTRKYGGSGLGLTISYRLVKLMKGSLNVESEVDKGSKFYFEIPIKEGKEIKESINSNQKIKENLTFLVAEDNNANQMFMKILLDKLKIKFDLANNGKEAIELAKKNKNKYDLILMDINMPIISGIDATKEIRKFSKIPIIALTASALDGDKERFIKAGMNDYLSKPLDIQKLKKVIEKYT